MPLRPATRRLVHWIAALAVLLAALAPAVSQALGARQAPSWMEICTAAGSTWLASDAAAPTPGDDTAPGVSQLLEHCPYCSIHAPVGGLPPPPLLLLPRDGLSHAVPAAFLEAPRTLHAWLRAQPRAPPLAG